jgi:hypothetical protein
MSWGGMTQILPFADPRVVKLYGQYEPAVYGALAPACSNAPGARRWRR